ncbi:hypothetical protein AYO44_00380 [Planctomycetaceae bacterium SCGC AG-212-F19]|nr:hypothetical protein AYO44_00380 [Planctomycetaceae bacterium SCGC AG-212-F19]
MAESADSGNDAELYRWQSLFQRTREPVFLLNRRRQIVFVNHAWEELTGIPSAQAGNLLCKRQPVGADPLAGLAGALAPPPVVRDGQAGRIGRLLPVKDAAPVRVEIDFFPLHGIKGLLGVLGKITPQSEPTTASTGTLPEKLQTLRDTVLQRYRFELHPGETPATQRVGEQTRLAAQTRTSVLIVGEHGTGKRWLARTIHHQGTARDRTLVALDCPGLPPAILTAALFGTEGLARRRGIGTIYLAHVTALPRELQNQLTAWLAEPEGERPRVIGSVVGDPAGEVQAGRLLQELYCSLGTLRIDVPPLRERLSELPLFVQSILDRDNAERSRAIQGLSNEAWAALRAFPWPGNLRELDAVMSDAHARTAGDRIAIGDLPAYVQRSIQLEQVAGRAQFRPLPLKALLEQVERRLIEMALRMAKGKKGRAARILSIWRPLLLRRMEKLGIKDE